MLHPGDPYAVHVWTNGKQLNSFGNVKVHLGLPVSDEAGDKLQAFMYQGKSWTPVTKGKGKAEDLTVEGDLAVFAAEKAASYVIGEVSIK